MRSGKTVLITIQVPAYVKRSILLAIIATAVILPGIAYAVSPYFTETTIDEPSPVSGFGQDNVLQQSMEKEEGIMEQDNATTKDQDTMMEVGDNSMIDRTMTKELSASFQGAGDGIHNASGKAIVLHLEDGSAVLRFEDFRVTNGPDLYVYLATDKSASDYIDLGRLKANSGNQNYDLPAGADLSKYNNIVIWCKAFSVYFGGAQIGTA